MCDLMIGDPIFGGLNINFHEWIKISSNNSDLLAVINSKITRKDLISLEIIFDFYYNKTRLIADLKPNSIRSRIAGGWFYFKKEHGNVATMFKLEYG